MKRGILFMLLATFAFAWLNLMAKYLAHMHPAQVVFFRAAGSFVFMFPYMLKHKVSFIGNFPKLLLLRGVLSFVSLLMFFYVLDRIPFGSAVAFRYVAPIFSVIFALFFLKERVKLWQWISFLISLGGVLLIKGFDLRIDHLSFVIIATSAVLVGGVFTLVRYLSSREHHLTIISYFMVVSIFGSLFFVNSWQMPKGVDWLYAIGIGVFGLIGQVFMTKAFNQAETNLIAPIKYMELFYAIAFGFLIWGETYSFYAVAGMFLLVAGMLLNIYVKHKSNTV